MAESTARSKLLAVTAAALLAGCWQSYQDVADGAMDGRIEVDVSHDADGGDEARVEVDAEADARVDVDVLHDADRDGDNHADADIADNADADADADATVCDGAWQDPTTGYLWENPPSDTMRDWDDAISYCNGLSLCGHPAGSWHLPTISELRSFIRGCPDTMVGGDCGVTDSCDNSSCRSSACDGCSPRGGPGSGGCYWDPTVGGDCTSFFWSSSSPATSASYAWPMGFGSGVVNNADRTNLFSVRCVHRDP